MNYLEQLLCKPPLERLLLRVIFHFHKNIIKTLVRTSEAYLTIYQISMTDLLSQNFLSQMLDRILI